MRSIALLATCMAALACGARSDPAAQALERARSHLPAFAQFARWARSVGQSQEVLRDKRALSEVMFASIRREPTIFAALVQLSGANGWTLTLPPSAGVDAELPWISVRDVRLGTLRVAPSARCALASPRPKPGDPQAVCAWIARAAPTASGAMLAVTLAFRESRL
jgi:hypothetical protein